MSPTGIYNRAPACFKVDLKHLILLIAITVTVGIVYIKVPSAYFCSYDDFIEIHRSAFEDSADSSRIITTPHFNSYRYRPLNRAVNFGLYRAGDLNPTVFRTRNLAFHLLNVILIYFLGWKLFGSMTISAVGALFFGLHPAANQTIIGAVNTNSMSHATFMGALLMLMRSIDAKHWAVWLTGSVLAGWLALLAYDSNITVFGMMFAWLILNWSTLRESLNHSRLMFVIVFVSLSTNLLTIYFGLRYLYVPQGVTRAATDLASAGTVLKNVFMYVGSLLSPLDVVLANELLNTPLPSEVQFHLTPGVIVVSVSLIAASLGFVLVQLLKTCIWGANYRAVFFLLVGIATPLLPVLLLQARPSETYLYLPVGFYSILVSFALAKVFRNAKALKLRTFYVPVVIVLIVLFSGATWVRNDRVFCCGQTAHRVLHSLPQKPLREGRWTVSFANIPGEETTRRYGFYGFRGVDTIGHGLGANWAITSALQLVYKNELLAGEIVELQQLVAKCRTGQESRQICVLVHSDGSVETVTPNAKHLISTH